MAQHCPFSQTLKDNILEPWIFPGSMHFLISFASVSLFTLHISWASKLWNVNLSCKKKKKHFKWKSILAQSTKKLSQLSGWMLCLAFLAVLWVVFVVFSPPSSFKAEKKEVSQTNISIKFSKLSSHALASFSPLQRYVPHWAFMLTVHLFLCNL